MSPKYDLFSVYLRVLGYVSLSMAAVLTESYGFFLWFLLGDLAPLSS